MNPIDFRQKNHEYEPKQKQQLMKEVVFLQPGKLGTYTVVEPDYENQILVPKKKKVSALRTHPFGMPQYLDAEDHKGKAGDGKRKKSAFEKLLQELFDYAKEHGAPYVLIEIKHDQQSHYHEVTARFQLLVKNT
jgi:hypothetical protein